MNGERGFASTWPHSSMWHRWEVGGQHTSTWTRRKNASRKWSSNWSTEFYGIKRPRQLANRDVFLKIGEPIDLGRFVSAYLDDAQAVRHGVAEQLRVAIQALINAVVAPPAGRE